MITIEQDLYEHKLLGLFWPYEPIDDEDRKVWALLRRICMAWVRERDGETQHETIGDISLSEEERRIVKESGWMEHPNLEVRTRCKDVMLRFAKGKNRIEMMREVSDGYLKLFKETGTHLFFVRSLELRKVRQLYDDEFLRTLRDVVFEREVHPGWLTKALNQVRLNVEDGVKNSYMREILTAYAKAAESKDVHWVDSYWDMMHEIGSIEDRVWHYRKALNWEAYADQMEANKKPNVFNMSYHLVLQDAYKEVFVVKEAYPEEFKRIRDKYNAAKKEFAEMMSVYGVQFKYEIPKEIVHHIHKEVGAANLEVVEQAIVLLMRVPFLTAWTKLVDSQLKAFDNKSDILERYFPISHSVDDEGNVSGVSDFERDKRLRAHWCFRSLVMYCLTCAFMRVKEHMLDYSEERFYKILRDCKPSFVDEEMVQIWSKAYFYYFTGDIVIASHLLMPQFERALRNLLEEFVGDVTKLNEELQHEPTLINVLKQLKPYCNPTLHEELCMFLTDGSDVNYRNNLAHGLMGTMGMLKYGHYMFYLANLLYFNGKDFLKIGAEE